MAGKDNQGRSEVSILWDTDAMRLIPRWVWRLIPHEHLYVVPSITVRIGEPVRFEVKPCSRCAKEVPGWPDLMALVDAWQARKHARAAQQRGQHRSRRRKSWRSSRRRISAARACWG